MKRIRLIAITSAILVLCLSLGMAVNAKDNPEPTGYNQAVYNILDFGAIPNDGKDDSNAFNLTVSMTAESIYIPPGVYNISEPILVNSASMFGAGVDKTVIVADIESTRDPIIWAGGNAQIRDMTIKFADDCIIGNEIAGERVGIITSARGIRRLCRGAEISNIKIQNVGTGIYAPEVHLFEKYSTSGEGAVAFSNTFENISVIDFSFRGISMLSDMRTGNIWRNIYLSSGKYEANTAIFFDGEESESSLTSITIADSKLKNGARFHDVLAGQISNLSFINTELIEDNTAFLYTENTDLAVQGLTFENSAPVGDKQSFIRLGDASFKQYYNSPNNGYLYVHNMVIYNPDTDVKTNASQYMIARKNKYLCEYVVDIDGLTVVAPKDLKAQYEAFNYDKRDIALTVNGEKK